MDINVVWLFICFSMLLTIVHLSVFVQKALSAPGSWRHHVLKWGSLFLIPLTAFMTISPAFRMSFPVDRLLATQQNWGMIMQNMLHQLGLVAVVLATLALLRGLIMNEKPTSLPATLVVLLVGYMLAANGQWPAVMTAGAITIALVIRQILADRLPATPPSTTCSTSDPKI